MASVLNCGPFQQLGTLILLQLFTILLSLRFICDSASGVHASNFTFQDGFTSTDQLLLVDDALYNSTSQSILLTANSTRNMEEFGRGMILYQDKVTIRDTSFSTAFTFAIHSPLDSWGDGFAFTFRGDAAGEGSAGEYLGLINSTANANQSNQVMGFSSLAIQRFVQL